MQSYYGEDGWPPVPPPPANAHPHSHPRAQEQLPDYGGIPTWPPPYPINTSAAPFTDPQPAISQRSFFTQYPADEPDPIPPSVIPAAGVPPSGSNAAQSSSSAAAPQSGERKRQRISRACDKCNQLRTKCDGREPCAHCVEFQQVCTYDRIKKKRGKVPKAKMEAMAREDAARHDQDDDQSRRRSSAHSNEALQVATTTQNNGTAQSDFEYPPPKRTRLEDTLSNGHGSSTYGSTNQPTTSWQGDELTRWSPSYSSPSSISINNVSKLFNFSLDDFAATYGDSASDPAGLWQHRQSPATFNIGTPGSAEGREKERIKYPILEPLLPYISSIIPNGLASQLLESYFASSTNAVYHPASPYLFDLLYNKRTFLSQDPPSRPRRPALLASMLWIAARTSDAAYFTSDPHTRSRICKRLLEVTIQLLNPLIHQPNMIAESSLLGQYQLSEGRSIEDRLEEINAAGTGSRSGAVDDIGTYIHVATVVSASENKRGSLRWWNAAYNFAREVQLGYELPPDSPKYSDASAAESLRRVSEEEREERRRTWWLLYMMDRHLALCYNRPIFLLNRECAELLHPMDDIAWQEGRFDNNETTKRGRGPPLLFASNSMFGAFLPLMTILGEIIDLHGVMRHPRLGISLEENSSRYQSRANAIRKHLANYEQSMSQHQSKLQQKDMTDYTAADHEMHTALAYSRYISNVLHILITGKWDPIELLEDSDMWLSTDEAKVASDHAVKAAAAVSEILEIDSDLSFMPYFLGIELLQGSFLLLVLADKKQSKATPELIRACEDMVRAHEACVVTLDTEYQRNFRKIMRTALAEVRGRVTDDAKAQQQKRRREVLSLYRWTNDGCGIAL